MCPSAAPRAGAKLLGLFNDRGELSFISPAMAIDEDFIQKAAQKGALQDRFRFSSPCVGSGCFNWDGHRCMVPDKVRKYATIDYAPEDIPHCAIRTTCRWHLQEGDTACKLCPIVPRLEVGFD